MVWGTQASNVEQEDSKPGLLSIMTEQMAEQLHEKEQPSQPSKTQEELDLELALKLSMESSEQPVEPKASSEEMSAEEADFALALQLQEEEDAALEAFRIRERNNLQGKVTLRYQENPYSLNSLHADNSETRRYTACDAEEVYEDTKSVATALKSALKPKQEKKLPPWPVRNKNLKGQGGNEEIITKHDPEITGRKNWEHLGERLCAQTKVGDFTADSHKISNRVFNSLKQDLKSQRNVVKGLSATVERDTIQTHAKGLDQKTRLLLHKLLNIGLFHQVNGVVRTGKEAIVYHASGFFESNKSGENKLKEQEDAGFVLVEKVESDDDQVEQDETEEESMSKTAEKSMNEAAGVVHIGEDIVLEDFAVKVFKTTLTEFKNRLDYVRGDFRFAEIDRLSKQNPRKVVAMWAEKEIRNLSRARKAGIPCPYPVRLYNNVLVMEFIGENGWAAPRLKEVELSLKRLEKCYLQVLFMMQTLATKCNLVHGDLSEYNLLYMRGSCYMIDMGQSVTFSHPKTYDFLLKDCANVTTFFKKKGVPSLVDAEVLAALLLDEVHNRRQYEDQQQLSNLQAQGDDFAVDTSLLEVQYAAELPKFASARFATRIGQERERLRHSTPEAMTSTSQPSTSLQQTVVQM